MRTCMQISLDTELTVHEQGRWKFFASSCIMEEQPGTLATFTLTKNDSAPPDQHI